MRRADHLAAGGMRPGLTIRDVRTLSVRPKRY
jgi:hypothetical protein